MTRAPGDSFLDRPAPEWVVATCDWISRRWLCPRGLTVMWRWANGEMRLRAIFNEPMRPVTWAHIFGRHYSPDQDAVERAQC